MTREQQRMLRELKAALPKLIKEEAFRYKIKKKDYMLYFVKKELFFNCHISISAADSTCYCSVREQIKPLWLDDIHWKLLGMESNSKQPVSLRAVGAFAIFGVNLYKELTEIETWSIDELREVVARYVEHFHKSIEEGTLDDFVNGLNDGNSLNPLRKAIYYIHEERYQEALDTIGEKRGNFINGSNDINESIRRYCQERLG